MEVAAGSSLINMTGQEHQDFIHSVLQKNDISVEVPDLSTSEYLERIAECFETQNSGYTLLAMSMASYLIDDCHEKAMYERLVKLSDLMCPLLQGDGRGVDLEITAQELRSALFWGYIRTKHSDVRLLDEEARLLSEICRCPFRSIRRADSVLTHGTWVLRL
jgi:hypothetical protein